MDLAFNLMRAEIASSTDEILFAMFVEQNGLRQAIHLAAKYDLKCERPLRTLLANAKVGGNFARPPFVGPGR